MSNTFEAHDPSVAYDATPPHAERREELEFFVGEGNESALHCVAGFALLASFARASIS